MSKFQCNSCGSIYSDVASDGATPLYHTCSPDVIEHATFDDAGKQLTPEKRTPRQNARDERPDQSVILVDGQPMKEVPDPETRGRVLLKPAQPCILSEGAGRTAIPE